MKTIKFLFTAILLIGAKAVFAAPSPPPSGGGATTAAGGPVCWPPPCVPIDTGIVFLIAAGALYGIKKIYDFRKKSGITS